MTNDEPKEIIQPQDPGKIVWREFEKDAAAILENQGLYLIDGNWKFFHVKSLKELAWSDVREFLVKNYSEKSIEGVGIYLNARRKQARIDRDANTLFRGNDCIVGQAEIPSKLLRALQMDFPEFGIPGDAPDPNELLKIFEKHSVLSCFVVVPTMQRNLDLGGVK